MALHLGTEARTKLVEGIHKLARAVVPTLGPRGRYAILSTSGFSPLITNDGVTIAKHITFDDPLEAVGADLIREVASKTNDVAGDGTTTATLLTDVLITEGLKDGRNPVDIREELAREGTKVVDYLRSVARDVSGEAELEKIATLSSRDEKIGEVVSALTYQLGVHHNITIADSDGVSVDGSIAAGYQFDGGYIAPWMMNRKNGEVVVEDPLILVTNKRISTISEIMRLMEEVAESGRKELVIIADAVDGDAIKNIEINHQKGTFKVTVLRAIGVAERQAEIVRDIAAVTGAKLFAHERSDDLRTAKLADLGQCHLLSATASRTTIVEGVGDATPRQEELEGTLKVTSDPVEKMWLQTRIARLSGKVGVISVGGVTQVEREDKKLRVEDALRACTATLEQGVVPGGGVALAEAAKLISSPILKAALLAPQRVLNENAGYELPTEGVFDPLKVTHTALQNAISVATLILLSESVSLK